MSPETLQAVVGYHQQTKHYPNRHARSLGYLDWATQPDPFRRFDGAEQVPLDHPPLSPEPTYDELFTSPAARDQALDRRAISRLFYDSLALSAWKQAPGSGRWSLRVNPSSGALHPTEGYLVVDAIEGIGDRPAVYHYSPMTHALERRVTLGAEHWDRLSSQLPTGTVLVALTSIYWRESWKYGERAFRYCHHDVGHAIGAVTVAAATLGCETRLVTTVDDDQLAALLGTDRQQGIEAERPDCLLAVFPGSPSSRIPWPTVDMPSNLLQYLASCDFAGTPNRLSSNHQPWPVIDQVAEATRASASSITAYRPPPWQSPMATLDAWPDRLLPAQQIIRQRRSAVDMDGRTSMTRDAFYRILARVCHRGKSPFAVLPGPPNISLAMFVHRVDDLSPGVYLLVRNPQHEPALRPAVKGEFQWQRPPGCPDDLPLWCLVQADCRQAAQTISCHQSIASEGVFAVGMLADLEASLQQHGPWFYPRLFWETGLIGQLLYLEAEAAGIRGTGIGCFFDDVMHELLGLTGLGWQSLYHFTVGGPVEDLRLQTLPPYAVD